MDIAEIPFNHFLGVRSEKSVVSLPADARYDNHIGTVHASAQFALAEAASGQWLLDTFAEEIGDYLAVVRHGDAKYRRPATGGLSAKTEVDAEDAKRFRDTLARRGRAVIEVRVQVLGADNAVTLDATFEWFAQRTAARVR